MTKKVMAAMSGGVDSSVAAALLMEQGYEVSGATLKLYANEDIGLEGASRSCCSLLDVMDASAVCLKLGIEHFVFNFGDAFSKEVIERFKSAYVSGKTPNPCIDCNRFIKFHKLLERAELLGMDYIATGHYARVERDEESGRYLLKKARDSAKDQTYVLYAMTQHQLRKTLFPLGALLKSEVRGLASQRGLINAGKPDSQDICFVPNGDYAGFLENTLKVSPSPGSFTDSEGRVLGEHRGLIRYTIGQRRGLGLNHHEPRYVIKKDAEKNTVVLGEEGQLYTKEFTVCGLNLISIERLEGPLPARVKTRYSQKEAEALLIPLDEKRAKVEFKSPQRAITPGQAAVFYDGGTVIGGGTIE